MNVSIVIPNWNGEALLRKHLSAVIAAAQKAEVIVVDDGSTDGSVGYVKKTYPSIRLIEKKKQEGFSSTINIGVRQATGEIVVTLNSDVEPEIGFLTPLLTHFDDPSVFAVGCLEKSHEGEKVVLRGRGEAAWKKGFYVHWRGEVDKDTTAWVSGGSGAFRKSIWEKLGGMDTLMDPFYWEDIDLSYRAQKAGYRTLFEPKSIVHHYHEKGKIQTNYSEKDVRVIAFRNQFIFIWKNIQGFSNISRHIFWLVVRLFQNLFSVDHSMMHGYFKALLLLPVVVSKRIRKASS